MRRQPVVEENLPEDMTLRRLRNLNLPSQLATMALSKVSEFFARHVSRRSRNVQFSEDKLGSVLME